MTEITEISLEKMQLAVLIDADNVSSRYAATIFEELENYGLSTYRRIYGNWSKGNGWTEGILLEHSIMPVQQFSYTTGKNATDMAMVIDAMDILYKNKVQGFCLVTSDKTCHAASGGEHVCSGNGGIQDASGVDQSL